MTNSSNPEKSDISPHSSEPVTLEYVRRVFTESEANALSVKEHSAEWDAAVTAAGVEFDGLVGGLLQTAVDDWKNRWL